MKHRGFPPVHAAVPNLAPMVDVVMVILIFFMLGTSFAISEGALPTQLPSRVGPGGNATVVIVPTVRILLQSLPETDHCRILVMERELSENSFAALHALLNQHRLAGADPNGRILIGADPNVQYQYVIDAMDAAVRAGFGNIQFSISNAVMSASRGSSDRGGDRS